MKNISRPFPDSLPWPAQPGPMLGHFNAFYNLKGFTWIFKFGTQDQFNQYLFMWGNRIRAVNMMGDITLWWERPACRPLDSRAGVLSAAGPSSNTASKSCIWPIFSFIRSFLKLQSAFFLCSVWDPRQLYPMEFVSWCSINSESFIRTHRSCCLELPVSL